MYLCKELGRSVLVEPDVVALIDMGVFSAGSLNVGSLGCALNSDLILCNGAK